MEGLGCLSQCKALVPEGTGALETPGWRDAPCREGWDPFRHLAQGFPERPAAPFPGKPRQQDVNIRTASTGLSLSHVGSSLEVGKVVSDPVSLAWGSPPVSQMTFSPAHLCQALCLALVLGVKILPLHSLQTQTQMGSQPWLPTRDIEGTSNTDVWVFLPTSKISLWGGGRGRVGL